MDHTEILFWLLVCISKHSGSHTQTHAGSHGMPLSVLTDMLTQFRSVGLQVVWASGGMERAASTLNQRLIADENRTDQIFQTEILNHKNIESNQRSTPAILKPA